MSEHKLNTATRYWARQEPESEDIVYFTTLSNAAHSRAEGDKAAAEITEDEYNKMVPEEARSAPFNPNPPESPQPKHGEAAIIEKYRAQCVGKMIGVHQGIIQLLMGSDITHAERVFVLEMVKHELLASMMQPQATNQPVH
jgi:hypothetical protein